MRAGICGFLRRRNANVPISLRATLVVCTSDPEETAVFAAASGNLNADTICGGSQNANSNGNNSGSGDDGELGGEAFRSLGAAERCPTRLGTIMRILVVVVTRRAG